MQRLTLWKIVDTTEVAFNSECTAKQFNFFKIKTYLLKKPLIFSCLFRKEWTKTPSYPTMLLWSLPLYSIRLTRNAHFERMEDIFFQRYWSCFHRAQCIFTLITIVYLLNRCLLLPRCNLVLPEMPFMVVEYENIGNWIYGMVDTRHMI